MLVNFEKHGFNFCLDHFQISKKSENQFEVFPLKRTNFVDFQTETFFSSRCPSLGTRSTTVIVTSWIWVNSFSSGMAKTLVARKDSR